MEYARAVRNPAAVFARPEDVCTEATLTREQKIAILKQWEYDARELTVAEEENMGGESNNMLDDVLAALNNLGGDPEKHEWAPTKQGGV
jgi:hypothetical protein